MNIFIIFLLVILGIFLLWQSSRQRKSTGLPEGKLVYSDTGAWGKVEKPLYDSYYNLTGKPDYIFEKDGAWIPVEVKSVPAPLQPYESHIYQLAAYCLLVERTMNKRPPYGYLHYRNHTFAIDFTPELEESLLEMISHMREDEKSRKGPHRSHQTTARCLHCGYRNHCDEAI